MTSLKKEKVDLSGLLTNIAADAQYEAEEHNITVQSDIQDFVIVEGEAELLYRAVENVVRNAIKFSHPSGLVTVALSKNTDQKMAVIKISDQGLGVPENELEAIFQPFMRSSQAQVKDGYGVGLAIAKQIVEAHAGKIYAKNQLHGGLQVEITLPFIDKAVAKSFV
jgi:two-component system OmpR family sensor kinase